MIVSVSRRTDIPAFFSDWFFRRWEEGFALVRNPCRPASVSRIALTNVDCVVFWSKNPAPMLARHRERLERLATSAYWQFTITGYGHQWEPGVPPAAESVRTFRTLSRDWPMVWRYDPILFAPGMDRAWHRAQFSRLAEALSGATGQCVISFLDFYRKTERNLAGTGCYDPPVEEKNALCRELAAIAARCGITVSACAEELDLTGTGVRPGRCIDPEWIGELCDGRVTAPKDPNQRAACGCVESVDLGSYDTCPHGCRYCYANSSREAVAARFARHDPASPLLFGELSPEDRITDRRMPGRIDRTAEFTGWA